MAQSRDISKYLCNRFITNPEDDHWYPKDPEKRKEVDAWLDWSKELHLALEMGVVGSYALPQQGCGWRDNYGIMACLISYKGKCKKNKLKSHLIYIKVNIYKSSFKVRNDRQIQDELRKQVELADEKVKERNIHTIEDLNIGDLATFFEITMPMEVHPEYSWDQYPHLNHLYSVCKQIDGFDKIHEPFLNFCDNIRHHREAGTSASFVELIGQTFVSVKLIFNLISLKLMGKIQ